MAIKNHGLTIDNSTISYRLKSSHLVKNCWFS